MCVSLSSYGQSLGGKSWQRVLRQGLRAEMGRLNRLRGVCICVCELQPTFTHTHTHTHTHMHIE
ncbi:hypothetical protein COCSADRAFT_213030 [Bipolaris sorokiniana ND90Pr]|uniref:Uncharacterized protein n=1 Tax=Cochliobolus sativus (strain ND90Pr / ATCC 201652) TaxID=665912 RepID=M2TLZ5_COCSN|nr:uncharacterized protein COCSADRAFT_213030 [Bipolaris sorokiniana ND90Pr]EMD69712.1 hypothetical protein COCSADRAFT_213030 [Bipolaris sorokiniana ND90Pr]